MRGSVHLGIITGVMAFCLPSQSYGEDACARAKECREAATREQALADSAGRGGVQGKAHAQAAQAYLNNAAKYDLQCSQHNSGVRATSPVTSGSSVIQRNNDALQSGFNSLANILADGLRQQKTSITPADDSAESTPDDNDESLSYDVTTKKIQELERRAEQLQEQIDSEQSADKRPEPRRKTANESFPGVEDASLRAGDPNSTSSQTDIGSRGQSSLVNESQDGRFPEFPGLDKVGSPSVETEPQIGEFPGIGSGTPIVGDPPGNSPSDFPGIVATAPGSSVEKHGDISNLGAQPDDVDEENDILGIRRTLAYTKNQLGDALEKVRDFKNEVLNSDATESSTVRNPSNIYSESVFEKSPWSRRRSWRSAPVLGRSSVGTAAGVDFSSASEVFTLLRPGTGALQ